QMMALPYFAAFYLTSAFLPGMLARRSGRIVNVGSPAAFAPWPGATGYAAARWALRGLTQALRADLHGTGVGVAQVIAGEVTSSYWENNPGAAARMPRIAKIFPKLTPEQVANAIVHGLERDSANVVVPFALRVALACHKIWPWPMERLLISTGHRRPATAPVDQRTQPPPGGPPLQM
ncbi:MAG TPA: SDR family NAD(P)-dependent oxidoreductase, partial [Magnetospirillaceae bacterium]|nr:SDR family NAD(P)-dependent oxidoreductase [Magnetospirillaceae bacterium]